MSTRIEIIQSSSPTRLTATLMKTGQTTSYRTGDDGDLEAEVGKCELGKGIVLYRGLGIHKPSLDLATNIARHNKIKIQCQASYDNIGYTSIDMTGEAKGVRALVFGIPLRSMHTPVETINLNDLEGGAKLLRNFLVSSNLLTVLTK